ncbi:DUF92 domain-containing protein [Proteinivorax tanatarense]|uniref:DUF92 domain-containing protein n=1 Tax=Proteinivorax tanatarense TaxID=1260629 RepID=A0AAU7VND4_9FIRM
MINLVIGFALSNIVSILAYKKESLNLSGAISAIILGTLLFVFGGAFLWMIMIGFFISSSVISKLGKRQKEFTKDINEKGSRRDVTQVLANGGLGLAVAFCYYLTDAEEFLLAYVVLFASVNADTWSSELGVLSKKKPVSILTFRVVDKGTSGGISKLGTIAAILGSSFIALIFFVGYLLTYGYNNMLMLMTMLCLLGGFLGSIIDSVMGGTVQGKFCCQVCNCITEKKIHHNKPTIHKKGWKVLNNEGVNFFSAAISSLIMVLIFQLF